jgi:hypothetical protein
MFKGEYSFRGTHAEKVKRLTSEFDEARHKMFATNYNVYLLSPIVGFLYGTKADLDKTGESTKIFPNEISNITDDLWFNYRLIMLLDKENEPDFNQRVEKAFRHYDTEKAKPDEELYESYVRGGINILHEKLIDKSHDYLKNLFEFMEEFDDLYSQNSEDILNLVQLAKG